MNIRINNRRIKTSGLNKGDLVKAKIRGVFDGKLMITGTGQREYTYEVVDQVPTGLPDGTVSWVANYSI